MQKMKLLASSVVGLNLLFGITVAHATDNYPNQAIKLVVPQAPGGGVDLTSRIWGNWVSNYLNTNVVVENRPGANGILATSHAKQQKADGYTLLVGGISQMTFNPHIYTDLPYSPEKDFDGVAMLVNTPFLLVASKKSKINSFEDFIKAAKAKPNTLNYASAGKGNSTHLAMEMLMKRTGISMVHVPYGGSAAGLNSIMAGDTDIMIDVLNSALTQVKADKVTPLAIIGDSKTEEMPNIPTLDELGIKEFPLPGWTAIVAPKNTPAEIRAKVNTATQEFFKDPEIKAQFEKIRMEPIFSTPEDVMNKIKADSKTWGAIIKELNISNTTQGK